MLITFNPDVQADRDQVTALLQEHRPNLPLEEPLNLTGLHSILRQMTDPVKYGETRLGYLRMLAQAGPDGRTFGDLMEHFAQLSPTGRASESYGGTHSSIEQSWLGLGGVVFAPKLIEDTPDGRQVLYAPAIPFLLHRLVGEPDDDE